MLARIEKSRKFRFFVILAALFFLLSPLCFAAEVHEGRDRKADLKDLLYRFINFALMLFTLIWGLKKARIKDFFSSRSEEIKKKLDSLKRGKEEAEKRYREIEKKLQEFEKEKENILERFRKEGIAEKERIIAEAKQRVKQIIEQAELTIEQEMNSAKERLKEDVVDLAAEKAQQIISRKITDKDQEHLVNEFLERVEKIH